eukprot:1132238-Pyramimonas_sp.AAC.1
MGTAVANRRGLESIFQGLEPIAGDQRAYSAQSPQCDVDAHVGIDVGIDVGITGDDRSLAPISLACAVAEMAFHSPRAL